MTLCICADRLTETQRPDATQHLRLYCDRIPGYQELAQYLAAGQPGEHAWDGGTNGNRDLIMWDDFCHHGELNLIEKYYHIWKGGRFVPYSEDYNVRPLEPCPTSRHDLHARESTVH